MLAESCVFDKQSQKPIYCGPGQREPSRAPLIANLRGHFAEFLNQNSPERLRLLVSPTCVGFSTVDRASNFRSFSWISYQWLREHKRTRPPGLDYVGGFSNPTTSPGFTDISIRTAHLSDIVPPSVHTAGAGMLTCCPSSTPFGLD